MFKVVLACILTIACSSVCEAKSARRQVAQITGTTSDASTAGVPIAQQSDAEPALRGSLPVTGTPSTVSPPAATSSITTTDPATGSSTTTTTATPALGPSITTTTTTTDAPGSPVYSTTTSSPASSSVTINSSGEQTTTTATSTDILYANPTATTTGAGKLRGMADITAIGVSARNLNGCPLSRDHDKGLKYVEVTVKNTGENIAVILGNSAHADVAGTRLASTPASQVEDSDLPRLNTKGRVATGVVTAFSFGFAGPIFYENLTPKEHRKRWLGRSIGRDGARHEVEDEHFGVRVIMPGDETVGWIAFRCPRDQQLKSLVVPVSFTRSAIPAGQITVQVADADTK